MRNLFFYDVDTYQRMRYTNLYKSQDRNRHRTTGKFSEPRPASASVKGPRGPNLGRHEARGSGICISKTKP